MEIPPCNIVFYGLGLTASFQCDKKDLTMSHDFYDVDCCSMCGTPGYFHPGHCDECPTEEDYKLSDIDDSDFVGEELADNLD